MHQCQHYPYCLENLIYETWFRWHPIFSLFMGISIHKTISSTWSTSNYGWNARNSRYLTNFQVSIVNMVRIVFELRHITVKKNYLWFYSLSEYFWQLVPQMNNIPKIWQALHTDFLQKRYSSGWQNTLKVLYFHKVTLLSRIYIFSHKFNSANIKIFKTNALIQTVLSMHFHINTSWLSYGMNQWLFLC